MQVNVGDTNIRDCKLIAPNTFDDHRGKYIETFNRKDYSRRPDTHIYWVQDDVSISKQWVLRGIHGDDVTWKLVSCLYGRIDVVVVDKREGGQWLYRELSNDPYVQILVPPGCGVGHLVKSEIAIFHYKQSTYYDPDSQWTLAWNGISLIPWALPFGQQPILSERDANATNI